MTDTAQGARTGEPRSNRPGSNPFESRSGLKTTEFMLTIIAAIAVVAASYASNDGARSFPIRWGWLLGIVVVSAYVVSRGFAKLGSRESLHQDR